MNVSNDASHLDIDIILRHWTNLEYTVLYHIVFQIDSDLVGRIPLCTYVIDDGGQTSARSNSGISGNVSSPIIHPEFGCVSCKVSCYMIYICYVRS